MAFYTKLDQVADKLRERIIVGEYERGEKLKQADIAAELGVSVTPVREALKTLEMEGYIISRPHKGLCVPEVNYEEVQETVELRLMMECDLTRRAVQQMTPEGLERLMDAERDFASCTKAGDLYGARAANVRFHFRLYELAKRPQSLQFVRVLWAKYPFNYKKQQTERLKNIVTEHDTFLEFVKAGDVQNATKAMAEHIEAGWKRVGGLLKEETQKEED